MPKLVANFVDDWIDHLAAQMRACWGGQVDSLAREKIPLHYFDSFRRRVDVKPRELRLSDEFVPPVAPETDWRAFARKVRNGADLNPHLSTGYASLFNQDGLLNDWGIHHFHLNMQPHPRKAGFLDRTGPVVLGYVTEDVFFAIGVYMHGKGVPPPWGKLEIMETLHRNWPEVIARFKTSGVSADQNTEKERVNMRCKHISQATGLADGTAYLPLGGMHSCSERSTSMEAFRRAECWRSEIEGLQANLERALPQLREELVARGYDGESDLIGKLEFTERGIMAYLPDYSLHVGISYVD